MKNLYNKSEFLANRSQNEILNENIFSFLGNAFNKLKTLINKIKGGKEVSAIYTKYIDKIQTELKNQLQINLQLQTQTPKNENLKLNEAEAAAAAINEITATNAAEPKPVDAADANANANAKPDANANANANAAEPKPDNDQIEKLKKSQALIQKIIESNKNLAIKEMDAVLVKMGGKEKNIQLATIIDIKKEQFNIDVLTAELKIYGDDPKAKEITAQLKDANKKIQELNKILEKGKISNEIEVGGKKFKTLVPYRYKKKGKDDNGKEIDIIKTIKIIKVDKGQLKAAYTYGESKDKEQTFDPNNVEVDFKPEINKEYRYINNDGEDIKVKVLKELDNEKVQVQSPNSRFVIAKGSLI